MSSHPDRRSVRVAFCATLCALLVGCPLDSPDDHLARGKQLAEQNDHNGAIIEFKNVLQSEPKSAEARWLLGRELLAQGQARAAEIELQKAYDGRYDRDAVVPLLVKSQVLQGQPEKISAWVVKSELKSPAANAEVQSWLGFSALQQGKVDEASSAYEAALRFDPKYPAARLGEARIKAMHGDLDNANAEVVDVLSAQPNNVEGLILKGDILRAKGKAADAIAAYTAATKQDPRSVTAHLALADAFVVGGESKRAEPEVAVLKKLAPLNPIVDYYDALVSFNRKDYLHANDAIGLSLRGNPANAPAQVLSGAISLAMNQPAQAEVHFIEGIKLSPGTIFTRRLLASLYLRESQPFKANEILQPALHALPDDSGLLSLGGEIALQMGNVAGASKMFDRAASIDPSNIGVRVAGAAAHLASGDQAAGFAALESAAKASVNDVRPDIALVMANLNRRDYDHAAEAWTALQKREPDNPLTYNLRAAIDLGREDVPAARKDFEKALQIQPTYFPAVTNLASLDDRDGNVDAARQRYRTLLAKSPNNALALLALAKLEAKHGAKPDVVLPLLQDARRAAPTAEQPVLALVDYDVSQNNPKQALSIVQEALAAAPTQESYLRLVGELQLQAGGIDQAIAAYRQLVSQRPDVMEYQVRLGQAMVQANQGDLAMPLFLNVVRTHPDAYLAQSAEVGTLLAARKLPEATQLMAEIRKVSPKSPALPELEGDMKLTAKQYAEAASLYRKVLAQTPSSPLVVKLYSALQLGGNQADGNAMLADWLKTHPQDTMVRMLDADMALRGKDYPRAIRQYRTALESRPKDAALMNNLALALWQQKDPDALAVAQKAVELGPDRPEFGDTLGWMLVEDGQIRKGIEILQKASAAAPKRGDIALHLAKAQIRDGRKDAARSTLQALLRTAPGTAEAKESRDLMATL